LVVMNAIVINRNDVILQEKYPLWKIKKGSFAPLTETNFMLEPGSPPEPPSHTCFSFMVSVSTQEGMKHGLRDSSKTTLWYQQWI